MLRSFGRAQTFVRSELGSYLHPISAACKFSVVSSHTVNAGLYKQPYSMHSSQPIFKQYLIDVNLPSMADQHLPLYFFNIHFGSEEHNCSFFKTYYSLSSKLKR